MLRICIYRCGACAFVVVHVWSTIHIYASRVTAVFVLVRAMAERGRQPSAGRGGCRQRAARASLDAGEAAPAAASLLAAFLVHMWMLYNV